MTKNRVKLPKEFESLVDVFFRPIIADRQWGSSLIERHRSRVIQERLIQLMKSKTKRVQTVTDYEAMLFLSQASMNAPLNHEWYKIYAHLFKKFHPNKSSFLPEHDTNLSDYELEKLETLKRRMFNAAERSMKPLKRETVEKSTERKGKKLEDFF